MRQEGAEVIRMQDTLQDLYEMSPWIDNLEFSWNTFVEKGKEIKLKKHTQIYAQYERADYVYLVAEGRVRLFLNSFSGEEKALSIIGKNGIIGECCIFEPHKYVTCAITAADTILYRLSKDEFQTILFQNSRMMEQVLYLVNYKYRLLCSQSLQLSYSKAMHRICGALIQLSMNYGEELEENQMVISISFTHQELANLVGSTRITVVKTLKQLEEERIVVRKDKHYHILDYRRLVEMTQQD
jgi:CRP/FNR family cyclic AMP-dependent transcriptional regulator